MKIPRMTSMCIKGEDTIADVLNSASNPLFVFACGYEERSVYQFNQICDSLDPKRILCLSFDTYEHELSFDNNRLIVSRRGIDVHKFDVSDGDHVVECLFSCVNRLLSLGPVDINIDYSSMPREWYCLLLKHCLESFSDCKKNFWYSAAKYSGSAYPCVGFDNFSTFSGVPRISQDKEIHIFGLGFDGVRSYGIWNYLDSDKLVTLVGRYNNNEDLYQRSINENSEIISSAFIQADMPIDDFPLMLGDIVGLTIHLSESCDVALVTDGPKPLIMAMSIAPIIIGKPGIFSWHIGHNKPTDYKPVDAIHNGNIFGFQIHPF